MDAAALLLELHGNLLRAASASQSLHFEGLGAAGRHLFRIGAIPPKTKYQFIKLDYMCAFVRHISRPYADQILADFELSVGAAVHKDRKEQRVAYDGKSYGRDEFVEFYG
jgi:hypothetical protein